MHVISPAHRESIHWYPRVRIEKYSPDQTMWAQRILAEEQSWGRRVLVKTLGILVPDLHGDWLRGCFSRPECGIVTDEGNGVTAAGLANVASVLAGAGGHALAPGRAAFGVGSDGATGFDTSHGHLAPGTGESPDTTLYRAMDARYPVVTRPALIMGQATFTETEACFPWHEWCWAAGAREPRPHHSLTHAYSGASSVMMNRRSRPEGYGTKDLGVAWVFRTQIELS